MAAILSLYGAWERAATWVLRVALPAREVCGITVHVAPDKDSTRPVLSVSTVPWGTVEDAPPHTARARVTLNGRTYDLPTEPSGDAVWAWLEVDPLTLTE